MISQQIRNTVKSLVEAQREGRMTETMFFAGMQALRDAAEDVSALELHQVPGSARLVIADGDNIVSLADARRRPPANDHWSAS